MDLGVSSTISDDSVVENSPVSAGDTGLIPASGGMAIHSSILTWKIPWTEEPDRLQSTGSQKGQTQFHH